MLYHRILNEGVENNELVKPCGLVDALPHVWLAITHSSEEDFDYDPDSWIGHHIGMSDKCLWFEFPDVEAGAYVSSWPDDKANLNVLTIHAVIVQHGKLIACDPVRIDVQQHDGLICGCEVPKPTEITMDGRTYEMQNTVAEFAADRVLHLLHVMAGRPVGEDARRSPFTAEAP